MVFGDYDLVLGEPMESALVEFAVLNRILYIVFSFVVGLILLNMLIAIMGSSYSAIQVWKDEIIKM